MERLVTFPLRVLLFFIGFVSGGGFCLLGFHLILMAFGYHQGASTLNWNFIDGTLYGLFGSPIGRWMITVILPPKSAITI